MTFEEELRRVVDQLADHLRHEAAGRLQSAMPDLYDAQMSEQKEAVARALDRAREEAEREFAERLEAARREATEQLDAFRKDAADRLAASELLATEQLATARGDHEAQIASMQRDTAEQLAAKEREIADRLEARERELGLQLAAKEREIADRLEARERELGQQLEARAREVAELAEAKERAEAGAREALDRAAAIDAALVEARERLELVENTSAERQVLLTTAAADAAGAKVRAHDAGLAEGRKEGREALAAGVFALGKAQSLSEVLDALSRAAERETAGVAVLLVRGDLVRTWRLSGFGEAVDRSDPFDIALDAAGVIREAVQTATIARGDSAQESSVPGFALSMANRRTLAAVPLVVGGQVVAVLYGEGPEAAGSAWLKTFEALAVCASRLLEAMTAFRTATLLATPREKGEGLRAKG